MNDDLTRSKPSVNKQRRNLLQGAVCAGVASFAPAVFANTQSGQLKPELSGELVCNIANPVKTLVLRNHSNKTIVVDQVSHGALMFDGSIVDCDAACMNQPISIPANQEVQGQFDRRQQSTLLTRADEYNRIQSRVTRLGDGTRVIPFVASMHGGVATII